MNSYLMQTHLDAEAIFIGLQKPPHGPNFNSTLVNRYPHIEEWYVGQGTVEYRLIGPAKTMIT